MKTAKVIFLLAALLFMTSLPFAAMGLSQDGFTMVDENNLLALYVDPLSGQVIVENKADGYLWRTNPEKPDKKAKGVHKMTLQSQLVLNYQSDRGTALSAPSQVESVNKDGLTVRIENKTAVCRYDFVKAEIAVTSQGTWEWSPSNKCQAPEVLWQMLAGAAANNANLLLNFGPKPDGSVPADVAANFRALGKRIATEGYPPLNTTTYLKLRQHGTKVDATEQDKTAR